MSNSRLISLSPKTLDKIARVDRLIRLGQRVTDACKTVGMTVKYYRKIKAKELLSQE